MPETASTPGRTHGIPCRSTRNWRFSSPMTSKNLQRLSRGLRRNMPALCTAGSSTPRNTELFDGWHPLHAEIDRLGVGAHRCRYAGTRAKFARNVDPSAMLMNNVRHTRQPTPASTTASGTVLHGGNVRRRAGRRRQRCRCRCSRPITAHPPRPTSVCYARSIQRLAIWRAAGFRNTPEHRSVRRQGCTSSHCQPDCRTRGHVAHPKSPVPIQARHLHRAHVIVELHGPRAGVRRGSDVRVCHRGATV